MTANMKHARRHYVALVVGRDCASCRKSIDKGQNIMKVNREWWHLGCVELMEDDGIGPIVGPTPPMPEESPNFQCPGGCGPCDFHEGIQYAWRMGYQRAQKDAYPLDIQPMLRFGQKK